MRNHVQGLDRPAQRYTAGFVFGRVWLGLLFLVLGVLWLLDNMRLVDSEGVLEWWPVILIAAGAVKLLDPSRRRPFVAFLLMAAGAWLLAHNLGYVDWGVWEMWPVLLIALGARIVWRGYRSNHDPGGSGRHGWVAGTPGSGDPKAPGSAASADATHAGIAAGIAAGMAAAAGTGTGSRRVSETFADTFGGLAFWSGVERKCTSQAFRGGDFTAFMGGGSVDVRAARPVPGGATIDVTVIMGGVEIVVPDDWQVVNEIQCVMGGVEDSRAATAPAGDRVLILKGFVLMGGVEIRNHPEG